jgi:hypothetical protein
MGYGNGEKINNFAPILLQRGCLNTRAEIIPY